MDDASEMSARSPAIYVESAPFRSTSPTKKGHPRNQFCKRYAEGLIAPGDALTVLKAWQLQNTVGLVAITRLSFGHTTHKIANCY
jgi:hypothetical protein